MNNMRLLNEYDQDRTVNGTKITFKIQEYVDDDDFATDDDFGDHQDTIDAGKRGDLFIGLIVVKASALGLTGSDAIGGCILHSVRWQDDSKLKLDVASCIDDHGMVEAAINECIENILEQAARLATFAVASVPCSDCKGKGYDIFRAYGLPGHDKPIIRIERCDSCCRFSDDGEAADAAKADGIEVALAWPYAVKLKPGRE